MGTDDIVLQIETDKVTVDVRYTTGKPGKLKEMLVKEEDTVAVGQDVAIVTEGEEGSKPEGNKVNQAIYSMCNTLQIFSFSPCQRTPPPCQIRYFSQTCCNDCMILLNKLLPGNGPYNCPGSPALQCICNT